MSDYFEFVELAVLLQAQGHRLGGRLHDAITMGLPQRATLLSTYQAETTAMQLYRKRGWVTLLDNFLFAGNVKQPFVIMGLDLSARPL